MNENVVAMPGASAINPNLGLVRAAEFELFRQRLKPGARVLELGGGSGYQARLLADDGFEVRSIDIDNPRAPIGKHFPVEIYDGQIIPAEAGSIDAVISSNVLEHIPTLAVTLGEIRRVLAPDGIAMHILPSAVWRWHTTMARYPFMVKVALGIRKPGRGAAAVAEHSGANRYLKLAKRVLFEPPHGESPGALSELYYFSGRRWVKEFESNGFEVVERTGNGLFYTGYSTLPSLPLAPRRTLARVLGSSCHLFVVRPRG